MRAPDERLHRALQPRRSLPAHPALPSGGWRQALQTPG